MTEGDVAQLLRETMFVVLKLGGPPLLMALVVGLLMSVFQAVTQINEQTLAFAPKAVALGGALLLLGSFMDITLTDFAHVLFDRIVLVGGS